MSYSAITAHLIKHALQQPEAFWDAAYEDFKTRFSGSLEFKQPESERVSKNLAIAYIGFFTLIDMAQGVLGFDVQERELFLETMKKACLSIAESTVAKMIEDKAGNTFLRELAGLLVSQPDKYLIDGLSGPSMNNQAVTLGWYRREEPDVVYLFREAIRNLISDKGSRDKPSQSLKTIADTLFEDGHLARATTGTDKPFTWSTYKPLDTNKNGGRFRVLAIKRESLFPGEITIPQETPDPVKKLRYVPGYSEMDH
jgi:hypothetical protein